MTEYQARELIRVLHNINLTLKRIAKALEKQGNNQPELEDDGK